METIDQVIGLTSQPKLGFQITFPDGWTAERKETLVQALMKADREFRAEAK